jgi:hypothetical protein
MRTITAAHFGHAVTSNLALAANTEPMEIPPHRPGPDGLLTFAVESGHPISSLQFHSARVTLRFRMQIAPLLKFSLAKST